MILRSKKNPERLFYDSFIEILECMRDVDRLRFSVVKEIVSSWQNFIERIRSSFDSRSDLNFWETIEKRCIIFSILNEKIVEENFFSMSNRTKKIHYMNWNIYKTWYPDLKGAYSSKSKLIQTLLWKKENTDFSYLFIFEN